MANNSIQIAMEASIFKRTGAYKRPVVPLESQVKTFHYTDHLKQVRELRMLRKR